MRRLWLPLSFSVVAVVAACMVNVGEGGGRGEEGLDPRARIGLSLAPLPLNLRGKDKELVGLGSYLVNTVGDCNGCHSTSEFAPGGDPTKGQPKRINPLTYLTGGRAFGAVVSPNLRPVIGSGLPAGASYREFLSGLRHGTDFDNPGDIQQVSPWPSYQNMAEPDLRAMYLYLLSLPPVAAVD